MEDRLSRLESRVEELARFVEHLEQRLTLLETRSVGLPDGRPGTMVAEGREAAVVVPAPEAPVGVTLTRVMSLVGRMLVVFGGAYLLRALTESEWVPPVGGIALGLAYAVFWFAMADRAARGGDRLGAAFHAVPAIVVAFPLLWEATTRFGLLPPPASAAAVALISAVGLAVARRQKAQLIAWLTTLAALATAMALIVRTGEVMPYALFLIVLGVATLWYGYVLDWIFLRWPVALMADVTVLALTLRAINPPHRDAPAPVLAVQLTLLGAYLASFAGRTLFRGRDVIPFEVIQTVSVLTVGFGGAVSLARAVGSGALALGWAGLTFGAASYAVAFAFVEGRQGRRKNFFFYTSLAIIFTLVGSGLILERSALAFVWAALAVVIAWLGQRSGRVTLSLHAAIYVVAAALVSELIVDAGYALLAPATRQWPPFNRSAIGALWAVALCSWIPVSTRSESWGVYSRLPRLAVVAVLVWAVGGVAITLLTPPLAGPPGAADPGMVAAIRMAVLVAGVMLLAVTGRYERFLEGSWLVYPVLIAGAVKLLVEDLPNSRAATLFVALALYGGALIAAPRLVRRRST
jgi:hypothetical protein